MSENYFVSMLSLKPMLVVGLIMPRLTPRLQSKLSKTRRRLPKTAG